MPHVTEELWSIFGFGDGSIEFAGFPEAFDLGGHVEDKRSLAGNVYEIVQAGRNLRSEARLATNQKAKFALRASHSNLTSEHSTIERLLNASELSIDPTFKGEAGIPVAMTRAGELFLVMEVDRAAERERLDKEIAKVERELQTVDNKLKNESFVKGAPAAVVQEHRDRQTKFSEQLAKLKQARAAVD
jgi:valyl-tRNA synthetase